ncbi:methyltransferase [Pseudomonas sp. FP453]|uniref:class I SAM-dependent methyltransferase n=1 Tax=Pseudomonas sp. FP453 TaxID=2954094 RepID=UPI002732FD31|nr:methyltransferase [Pseudomonas sp. FP453]WLH89204.1 methyltransferase [Pseudomonas sp. FP453]
MKTTFAVLSLTALLLPTFSQAADAPISAQQYASVLAGSWRDPANSARDGYRHPQQTLAFFGLGGKQTVIEITPGGGWYSELLAPLLNDHGHYIAAVQAANSSAYARTSAENLQKKFAADPARYGKAQVVEFEPKAPVFGPPGSADAVLTFRNVHNWVEAGTAPATFSAFYTVLKPGGVLGVEDHRAKDGAHLAAIKDTGYLTTAQVVKLATDAGFKLAAQSEVNANPKDTKDYPAGVWTLPPTLRLGEQDKARYVAIGESDRMTLRFVKPAK